MVKMTGVIDPLAELNQQQMSKSSDAMLEGIKKASKEQKAIQGKEESLDSRLNYAIRLTKRAKKGNAVTKAMTFEITADLEEALRELVADKKKEDSGFNKSIAIRKGIAMYLSLEGYGKKKMKGVKDGTGKDSSTKKSN